MKEDYVTFEQALKLKELGFNWKCIRFYNISQSSYPLFKRIGEYEIEFGDYNNKAQHLCSAPTLTQSQKWLREVKGIHVWVESEPNEYDNGITYAIYVWDNNKRQYPENYNGIESRNNYEQALSLGIDKALKILI